MVSSLRKGEYNMEQRVIAEKLVKKFEIYLHQEDKSQLTIEKYIRDVQRFMKFADGLEITKETALVYKQQLMNQYAARSVNSMLASLGSFFSFLGWADCKVKSLKLQQDAFVPEERGLSKSEYFRLLKEAEQNQRLYLILQTICSTGIRISELKYFTLETVQTGTVTVRCKCKTRNIFIPGKLKQRLLNYAQKVKISTDVLFCTRSGRPVNRSNIWSDMKRLCVSALVNPKKVFPHNLRKLFARTFYDIEKDIAKLADILGHSSINTTRIYIMTTGTEHSKKIERLGFVV